MPHLVLLFALSLKLALKPVAGGFDQPTAITSAGDGRLFITLQRGQIIALENGARSTFLDIRPLVSCCGERGLLSVAFHPHFAQNGFYFVDYTDLNGDTVIARYSANGGAPLKLLTIAQPFANHNGGQLQFGPDGYLYIGMGDGGSGGDPGNRAQDLSTLLGKLLRIDVDNGSPYSVPPSNPFVSRAGARGEIWAYGLRNPWRFSFDRATGDLWMGDVGQNAYEEVDWQLATSPGGENYGWRRMEGLHCFNPTTNCAIAGLVAPVVEYTHDNGRCSVSGGYRYRGNSFPSMNGIYFYGDYCSGEIWGAVPERDGTMTVQLMLDTTMRISAFGEDANGELYVADIAGGSIYQLVDATPIRRRAAAH